MKAFAIARLTILGAIRGRLKFGPAEHARQVGSGTPAMWSGLMRGHESFGEKLARKIEANLGYPPWPLDHLANEASERTAKEPFSARAPIVAFELDALSPRHFRDAVFEICERLLEIDASVENHAIGGTNACTRKKVVAP